jgi:hypothetical protein
MTKDEAIAYFGTQVKLAAALGIYQSVVSEWNKVPLAHQFYLEKITNGALKADPHPAELRSVTV